MAPECQGKLVLLKLKQVVAQKYEKLLDPDTMVGFISQEGPKTVHASGHGIDDKGVWINVLSYPMPAEGGGTEVVPGKYLVPWEDLEEVFVSDREFQPNAEFALGYVRKTT